MARTKSILLGTPPYDVERALARLGQNLRTARLLRNLTIETRRSATRSRWPRRRGAALGRLVHGRTYLARHNAVPIDPVELPLAPDDRAGALGFGLNAEPPPPRRLFNRTLELETLQRLADAIVA